MGKIKIVHYINQFYAGIGGEDKADTEPLEYEGVKGPGMGLKPHLGDEAEIVATVVCGDSYFGENIDEATKTVLEMIGKHNPDVVITGPAFNAGRYGIAAGAVAKAVTEELGVPSVTGMYEENPGVDMFRKFTYIIPTANSAAGMKDTLPKLAALALKLARKETLDTGDVEGYMERGVRRNFFMEDKGAKRAVEMLVAKLKGEEFTTEYPMPKFDRVDPQPPIKDITKARIAIVSSGGPVPKGNPDHIESSSASKYGRYSLEGITDLTPENGETAHGGYDPTYANDDLDRVIPVDVLREMEENGEIGSLHEYYYSTVGNGTAVSNANKFAAEIADYLKEDNVDAVILTSTWGTCTRCGATMVKEIESRGFPVVHMCTVVPISMTVGANRIVPTVAIPHPLGDPTLTPKDEKVLRRKLVEKALAALETEVDGQTVFEDE